MVKHICFAVQPAVWTLGKGRLVNTQKPADSERGHGVKDQVTRASGSVNRAFRDSSKSSKVLEKKQGGFNAKNAARRPDMWCLSDGSVSSDFGEYPMGSHFWHKPISMWRRPESYNVVPPTCVCWFINPSNYSYFIIITWLNLVINPLSQLYIVPTYRYGLIINGGNDNLSFGGNSGRWKKQLVICWFIFIQSISIYIYPDN